MIEELLKDIYNKSGSYDADSFSQKAFIETILDNIYQFLYKSGQPVHTIAIGILRGNTFDMYYRGRILNRFAEMFGAMSYDSTIAGRACELFKKNGQPYFHLFSKKKIFEEFEIAAKNLRESGFEEEAEALRKRADTTIDQGVRSFLLMPITFGNEIIGIFTISSVKESDEAHILGETIEKSFIPIARMLSLILYMEKISYDKAEEMGRLLISSIDGKDEYQTTHSLNVRTMVDIIIDELSRDKELRERVESIGFKLTVDRIERLRLAALLHDMGKIFVPSKILRKYGLNKEEHLIRKMHSYYTYNILNNSKTLRDIADIASLHHARYFIPTEKYEGDIIGYPYDRLGQDKFAPESQIIALADTVNSIIRERPDRKGLSLDEALNIIEKEQHKFQGGLKDIFVTIIRRVEENLKNGKYPSEQAEEYRSCLWLECTEEKTKKVNHQWKNLNNHLEKIRYNNLGIVAMIKWKDGKSILDKQVKINKKTLHTTSIENKYIILSIINIPKEEGFIWLNNLFEYLRKHDFKDKTAFTFVSKNGHEATLEDIYVNLQEGLKEIRNEPVHYYLNPKMYKLN